MKKIIAALSICAIGAVTVCSMQDNVKAEEEEADFLPYQSLWNVNTGDMKALIVRVGFKDYPANESNPNYLAYDDKFLLSLFEGKEGGFGLPYNGLSEYLFNSSYGKLSMSVGSIIDIQLNNTLDSYYNEVYDYETYEEKGINFFLCPEFMEKLNEQIMLSDYDKDGDGYVDALYIWDMSGELGGIAAGRYNGYYVAVYLDASRKYEKDCLDLLIHETGHLLLGAYDYYLLGEGTIADEPRGYISDIGNIYLDGMYCDYDGWTKYQGGWLTADNVTTTSLKEGDEGTIFLTPYDSDIDFGKKLAVLYEKQSETSRDYIVVDYCGGLNNNQLDTDKRKEGFRFYKCEDNRVKDITYSYDEEGGMYTLFSDGDETEIEFPETGNKLKIYDIQTGDNPSFKYSFKKMDTINPPEIQEDPEVFKTIDYRVKVVDGKGNIITDDLEIYYEDITETGFVSTDSMGNNRCLVFIHDETTNSTDTLLRFESVPEGYKKLPDVKLHASAITDFLFEVTSDSENVRVSTDPTRNEIFITITLEEGTDNNNSLNEELTEPSEEQSETAINQINQQDESKSQEYSKDKTETKEQLESNTTKSPSSKPTTKQSETATPKSSGIVSKVSSISPKSQGVVATTNKTAPQTGDKSLTPLWITIAGTSAGVLATAVIAKRKKKI